MATHTEKVALKVIIDELEQIPVRGAKHRQKLEQLIDCLVEMSKYTSFESGHYRSMEDLIEIMQFYRESRARNGGQYNPYTSGLIPYPKAKDKVPSRKKRIRKS